MPPPPRRQPVIARRRPSTLGASPLDALMRLQGNLNAVRMPSPTAKPNLLVNKPHMVLNSVQNRFNFELDGWSPFGEFVCCSNHRLTPPSETRHLRLNLFVSQPRCLRRAPCALFFSVVNFPTLSRQVTHKLCYRADNISPVVEIGMLSAECPCRSSARN